MRKKYREFRNIPSKNICSQFLAMCQQLFLKPGPRPWTWNLKNLDPQGWHTYQSCYEKLYLDVCGWVGFLAQCFIRGNLTFFEIPNKSFVLYAFISKNRHVQDLKEIFLVCIFSLLFRNIAVMCLFLMFHISRLRNTQKMFIYNALLRWWKTVIHIPKTHVNLSE